VIKPDPTGKRELVVTRFDAPAGAEPTPQRNGRARAPRPTIEIDRGGKGVAS